MSAMLSGVLSSYEKYFVPDDSEYREDGEHIDILIQKRNLRAQKVKQNLKHILCCKSIFSKCICIVNSNPNTINILGMHEIQ